MKVDNPGPREIISNAGQEYVKGQGHILHTYVLKHMSPLGIEIHMFYFVYMYRFMQFDLPET